VRSELTELEQCVTGVVWRDGPLTAYEVASLFARSLSPYWSGSAGAIYPAVKRLMASGLLRGKRRDWNGKNKTVLTATPAGVRMLRGWLGNQLPPEAGAPTFDPVRTRMFFIDVLSPGERHTFVKEAERVTREQLARTRQTLKGQESRGETSEALGSLGAIYELEARLRWLRAVRKRLGDEG
jgi:DNA-binding PadR family transcriptional regulator